MDEQTIEQVKGLFQEAYSAIYSDGAFDAMADQAEADGDVVPAVSQLTGTLINSMVKDAGVTDVEVLFGVAFMLILDMLEALQEVGMTAPDGSVEAIVNKTMQTVLGENPSIAQEIANNPEIQEAMQSMGGPEGMVEGVQEQAAAGGPVAQGVMEGAQTSQGGV